MDENQTTIFRTLLKIFEQTRYSDFLIQNMVKHFQLSYIFNIWHYLLIKGKLKIVSNCICRPKSILRAVCRLALPMMCGGAAMKLHPFTGLHPIALFFRFQSKLCIKVFIYLYLCKVFFFRRKLGIELTSGNWWRRYRVKYLRIKSRYYYLLHLESILIMVPEVCMG